MLLNGKEVHRQDKLCREEHLNEETLCRTSTTSKFVGNTERAGKQTIGNGSGGNGGDELGGNDGEATKRLNSTDKD